MEANENPSTMHMGCLMMLVSGLSTMVTAVFFVLKLCKALPWAWIWVWSPMWICAVVSVASAIVAVFWCVIIDLKQKKKAGRIRLS